MGSAISLKSGEVAKRMVDILSGSGIEPWKDNPRVSIRRKRRTLTLRLLLLPIAIA